MQDLSADLQRVNGRAGVEATSFKRIGIRELDPTWACHALEIILAMHCRCNERKQKGKIQNKLHFFQLK